MHLGSCLGRGNTIPLFPQYLLQYWIQFLCFHLSLNTTTTCAKHMYVHMYPTSEYHSHSVGMDSAWNWCTHHNDLHIVHPSHSVALTMILPTKDRIKHIHCHWKRPTSAINSLKAATSWRRDQFQQNLQHGYHTIGDYHNNDNTVHVSAHKSMHL